VTPLQQLDALRQGPFAGHGGAKALAHEIGVTTLSVEMWRNGKRNPSYQHRQKIESLYKQHFITNGHARYAMLNDGGDPE